MSMFTNKLSRPSCGYRQLAGLRHPSPAAFPPVTAPSDKGLPSLMGKASFTAMWWALLLWGHCHRSCLGALSSLVPAKTSQSGHIPWRRRQGESLPKEKILCIKEAWMRQAGTALSPRFIIHALRSLELTSSAPTLVESRQTHRTGLLSMAVYVAHTA